MTKGRSAPKPSAHNPRLIDKLLHTLVLPAILLTGCQSLSTSSTAAHIRIIDASPDAPKLDVYHRTGALTYNLDFANITSYIEAPPGPADLTADVSGSHQPLIALHETLLPSARYTLLLGGTANTLQSSLLRDQSTPAPTGQVALRFLNQINAEAAVDVYLLPTGAPATATEPLLVNQAFAANSGYLTVPAAAYRIVLYPAGTTPSLTTYPAYSGPTVAYASGAARTIILIDRKGSFASAFQTIATDDFDPAATTN